MSSYLWVWLLGVETSKELQQELRDYFFQEGDDIKLNRNLHRGCLDWDQ